MQHERGVSLMSRVSEGSLLSTVFVDYDNIYLSLKRKNEEAAKRFAKDAGSWLTEIASGRLITPTNGPAITMPRRIVMNRCYGNPVPRRNTHDNSTDMNSFPFVRHHYLRAGFEVIDCPPLTAQLKNSADIRMVMDVRDYLLHDTYFDEFIILSGDADFTPVLHRLRQHARRTVIYSNDYTAAPYTAISDGEVREDDLIAALIDGRGTGALTDEQSARKGLPNPAALAEARRAVIADVVSHVRAGSQPLLLEVLADRAVRTLGHERTVGTAWGGAGSFRDLLVKELPDGVDVTEHAPHYVLDTTRQATPLDLKTEKREARPSRAQVEHLATSFGEVRPEPLVPAERAPMGEAGPAAPVQRQHQYTGDTPMEPQPSLPERRTEAGLSALNAPGPFGPTTARHDQPAPQETPAAAAALEPAPAPNAPAPSPAATAQPQPAPRAAEPAHRPAAPAPQLETRNAQPAPTAIAPEHSVAAPQPQPTQSQPSQAREVGPPQSAEPMPAQQPTPRPAATQQRAPQPSDHASAIQKSIARIHEACQAPPISPPEYRVLFDVMAEEINTNGLTGTQTLVNICERAKALGVDVRKDDARFILEVVSEADPWFEQGASSNLFASRFRNFVVARCKGQGLQLSATELDLIEAWFTGASPRVAALKEPVPEPRSAQIPAPAQTVPQAQSAPQSQQASPAAAAPNPNQQDWFANEPQRQPAQAGTEQSDFGRYSESSDDFPRVVRARSRA